MFYRPFDRSMGVLIIKEFLNYSIRDLIFTPSFYIFTRVVQAATSKARRQSEHPSRQSLWYDKDEKQVKQFIQLCVCLVFLYF